jgi:hypothetical protein
MTAVGRVEGPGPQQCDAAAEAFREASVARWAGHPQWMGIVMSAVDAGWAGGMYPAPTREGAGRS